MIIPRQMNAIKRMEAVKQRGGHSRKNDALIQDSPGVCRQVVADGARGGVAHSPWLEMALPQPQDGTEPRGYGSIRHRTP